jgi:hypothetical protein
MALVNVGLPEAAGWGVVMTERQEADQYLSSPLPASSPSSHLNKNLTHHHPPSNQSAACVNVNPAQIWLLPVQ